MRSRMMKNQLGFTLMEMLAAVVIIGIVLGIGTPFVMNIVKDSSTQDFVSNAKTLEDASHMYYRDYGVLPSSEKISTDEKQLLKDPENKSRLIIKSELLKAGITNSDAIIDKLIDDDMISRINYDDLKEYTRVTYGDEGSKEFVIIEMVEDLSSYGIYENDIAGYVFSVDTRDTSSGLIYSGAYSLAKDKATKDNLDREEGEISIPGYDSAKDMTPYGFRLVKITKNNNGTADVQLSWTNRVVDDSKNELRGYVITDFEIDCDKCSPRVQTFDKDTLTTTLTGIPMGEVTLKLRGNKVEFAGNVLNDKTKWANVNGTSDGKIDLIDELTNPGQDSKVPVGPGLEEVTGGDQYDNRDKLYKELEENSSFNKNNVVAKEEGLEISGLNIGDRIVLKELLSKGSTYEYDANRTRLFIISDNKVLIPKDPYLQKDFQKNPNSEYNYIIEVYKNLPCAGCSDKLAPTNGVVIYYNK